MARTRTVEKVDHCTSMKFVKLGCDEHEEAHTYQIKHNLSEMVEHNCQFCLNKRRRTIIAKAMFRYRAIGRANDRLTLWTFGTSLHDTPYNRDKIGKQWRRMGSWFRSQYRKSRERGGFLFRPLMNSLEAGSKGGRLHYHMVVRGYMDFGSVHKHWRRITGEKSNVQYSFKARYSRTAVKSFAYLAKYAAKGGSKYYFMGDMLKIRESYEPSSTCKKWVIEFIDLSGWSNPQMEIDKFDFG